MLNEPLINPIVGPVFSWKSLNIAEDARIDVSGKRFWMCSQMAFSDIKVFYPLTTTTCNSKSLKSVFKTVFSFNKPLWINTIECSYEYDSRK